MKLYYWMSCPFACKVLCLLDELNLKASTHLIAVHPWQKNHFLADMNPLNQIPVLELGAGAYLYDSNVICEYLATKHQAASIYGTQTRERWAILRFSALANGIMEASVLRVLEEYARSEDHRSPPWIDRQNLKIIKVLDYFEQTIETLPDEITIAHISIFMALSYLNLRFPSEKWGEKRPHLLSWHTKMMKKPSFYQNHPQDLHSLPSSAEMDRI